MTRSDPCSRVTLARFGMSAEASVGTGATARKRKSRAAPREIDATTGRPCRAVVAVPRHGVGAVAVEADQAALEREAEHGLDPTLSAWSTGGNGSAANVCPLNRWGAGRTTPEARHLHGAPAEGHGALDEIALLEHVALGLVGSPTNAGGR